MLNNTLANVATNINHLRSWTAAAVLMGFVCSLEVAAEPGPNDLATALVFHASFDGTYDAHVAGGDGRIYTATTLAREEVRAGNHRENVSIAEGAGRYGDALRFAGNSEQVLFYKADALQFREQDWSGAFSFWLKLDPDQDLEPGYCDPIQITERAWNDAALFVDFDRELPRDFRLGVFSDLAKWNPEETPWDDIPVDERPMVVVKQPPFSKEAWTHVAFTFQNINAADDGLGSASLYLNGELQGTLRRPFHLTWDVDQAAVMIGIQYIGDFDDLAIFNRALTAEEIAYLRNLPRGVSEISASSK